MKQKSILQLVVLIFGIGALVWAISLINHQTTPDAPVTPGPPKQQEAPKNISEKPGLQPGRVATVVTSKGAFKFVMYEKDMPITTKNFISLAQTGFYKGHKFHRVEDWVIQTGDPTGTGRGGSKKTIPLETKQGLGFEQPYMVGMARTQEPNSATSQFFITRRAVPELSGQYAAFGVVIEGQNVINDIKQNDKVVNVTIADASASDLQKLSKK